MIYIYNQMNRMIEPVDGFFHVVNFKSGYLNFTPLRRLGFRFRDGARLLRWVCPRFAVRTGRTAPRLFRHLPMKFAGRKRLHLISRIDWRFTLARVPIRFVSVRHAL